MKTSSLKRTCAALLVVVGLLGVIACTPTEDADAVEAELTSRGFADSRFVHRWPEQTVAQYAVRIGTCNVGVYFDYISDGTGTLYFDVDELDDARREKLLASVNYSADAMVDMKFVREHAADMGFADCHV
ncbi:hypothetical protein D3C85_410160 [compost metagenome]